MTDPDSPNSITIELTNDLATITFARMVLQQVLPPLEDDSSPMFFGALTEVITNAMQANLRCGSDEPVVLTALLDDPPELSVRDHGGGFDPGKQVQRTNAESGMGLMIARAVIPGLRIESSASGTVVHMPYLAPL